MISRKLQCISVEKSLNGRIDEFMMTNMTIERIIAKVSKDKKRKFIWVNDTIRLNKNDITTRGDKSSFV